MATAPAANTSVGTIKVTIGDVKIVGVDGVARQAQVGDRVFARETLQTGPNAIVQVQLQDGRMLDLGRDSKLALDNDVLGPQGPSATTTAPATGDVAALQAQIAAGADPSKVAEATAAGGAPGAGGADGSGGTAVIIDQANSKGPVTSGFNTAPAGIAFPELDGEVFINRPPVVISIRGGVNISEEGLDGRGNPDGTGNNDTTNFPVYTGQMEIFDPDGNPINVDFGIPSVTLFSHGDEVLWRLEDDNNTLIGYVNRSGEGQEGSSIEDIILRATIDDDGNFTVEVLDQIDHPVAGEEDDLDFDIPVIATDIYGASGSGVLNVNIEDDSPTLAICNDGGEGSQHNDEVLVSELTVPGPGEGGNSLINGLGGSAGYGENTMFRNDDGSTGFIDVTSIFGPGGMNFFGTNYTGFYINNNGNITFGSALNTFTPFNLTGASGNPIIAPFFADVDTRPVGSHVSPGGTSTGSNAVYWDLDTANGVITITWDDVGYFSNQTDLVNAFQLRIFDTGNGNFSFEFRYENVEWTTGGASGGSGGLGGTVARAGWNSGSGEFFELPQSGNQSAILDLENTSNPNTQPDGTWVFNVVGGVVVDHECVVSVTGEVREDGMRLGTGDSSEGNQTVVNTNADEHVSAAGSLRALYSFGADGPGDFTLLTDTSDLPQLYSNGDAVWYEVVGNVLTAYANGSGGGGEGEGDRVVFTLTVDADGTWSFDLTDQLDHVDNGNDDENTRLVVDTGTGQGSVPHIDFSSIIHVTDYDGDPAPALPPGTFNVTVVDDIPVVEGSEGAFIRASVEEDDMSRGAIPADLSDGNNEDGSVNADEASGPAGSLHSLFRVGADEDLTFSIKLDEGDLPNLFSQGDRVEYRVEGNTLIAYVDEGDGDADADADADGDLSGERVVFTLTVNADGSWAFDLQDQLDHTQDGNTEGWWLRTTNGTGQGAVPNIDFTRVILATDADGDSVEREDSGRFTIAVQDDIPVRADGGEGVHAGVEEDGMSLGYWDYSDPSFPVFVAGDNSEGAKQAGDTNADDETSGGVGSLTALFSVGADEPATISLNSQALGSLPALLSKGEQVEYGINGNVLTAYVDDGNGRDPRIVFTLTVNGDGSWNFDLRDQLDHVDDDTNSENTLLRTDSYGSVQGSVASIDFSALLSVTDADGDTMHNLLQAGDFTVTVQDDVPMASDNQGAFVSGSVEEDGMSMIDQDQEEEEEQPLQLLALDPALDNSEGNKDGIGDDNTDDETSGGTGSLGVLFASGADEPLTYSLKLDDGDLPRLLSQGDEVTYAVDGNTLTATADGRTVFTLTVNSDGSWSFDLRDQLDHVDDDTNTENWALQTVGGSVSGIDFTKLLVATDFDGDSVELNDSGRFVMSVQDDIPSVAVVVGRENSVTLDTQDAETDGDPTTFDTATTTANFGGVFSYIEVPGSDEPVNTVWSYALGFTGNHGNGADSGLKVDVNDAGNNLQQTVYLYQVGNYIVGSTDATAPAYPEGENVVFNLTVNSATGEVTLTQFKEIDHAEPGVNSNFDDQYATLLEGLVGLTGTATTTDFDGDTVSDSQTIDLADNIRFADDGPTLSGRSEARTVDEDDIDTAWSQGTSPNDGAADGSTTENSSGAAFISGSLAPLVNTGADAPVTYGFTDNVLSYMTGLGLYSKQSALPENGQALTYTVSGPVLGILTLTATEPDTAGPSNTSNPVFELKLNTVTGEYEFRLFDELIHKDPATGADENTDLRSGPMSGSIQPTVPNINFGAIIKVTDDDGDWMTLSNAFTVTVTDDIPEVHLTVVRNAEGANHDETPGTQNDDTTSGSVAALFSGVSSTGNDPDVSGSGAIGYARSGSAVVTVNGSEVGADSPPLATGFTLEVLSAVSGLQVTDGSAINLAVEGGLIVGRVSGGAFNGQAAFAVAVDSDGEIFVAQYLSIQHPTGGASHDEEVNLDGKIQVRFTVTDSDGDTVSQAVEMGELVRFDDDGPSVSGNQTVVLEDDDVPGFNGIDGGPNDDNAPQNTAGTLSHNYGADGAGSVVLLAANLPSTGGFSQSLSGDGLTLTISQGSTAVLQVTLANNTSGNYTVTQLAPISHPDSSGSDENNVNFTLNYRVTDGDGDTTNGAMALTVDDDSPEPNFVVQQGAFVIHDETPGVDAGSNDTAADLSALFAAVTTAGDDPDVPPVSGPIGYAQSAGAVVAVTPNYGADGAGSTVYSIDVPGSDEPSGLMTTSGQPITLFEVNSTLVVGRYDGPDGGSTIGSGDPAAFAIHIDPTTGVMTVVQYVSLKHDDRGDADEANDNGTNGNDASPNDSPDPVQQALINDALRVTVAVTDSDGDTVSQQFDVGSKVRFEDDGPSISVSVIAAADALTVDETNLIPNASANFADNFSNAPTYGADGAGTVTSAYALSVVAGPSGLVDVATNQAVVLSMNGSVVEGRTATSNALVFTVNVSGGGVVTLDQLRAVVHPNASNPDDAVTLNAANLVKLTRTDTITDADGDASTGAATIDIGTALTFKDDGPSISVSAAADALVVDETNLTLNASANFADNFTSAFGADGAGTITYALGVNAGTTGLVDTASNQAVVLSVNGSGVVEGRTATGNDLVFTVSVNSSGVVTLDQLRAVVHTPNTGPDQSTTLNAANLVTLTATITDKDGDAANATTNIAQALSFKDDGPSISVSAAADALTVDETNLTLNASANFADNFTSAFGADGAGTITYALGFNAGTTGLVDVATNQNVVLSLNGGVVEGRTATSNDLVFTVGVDGSGIVTLDQQRAVKHPNMTNPDDTVTLNAANLVTLTATITDKDGDASNATLGIGQALSFKDDGPSITLTPANLVGNGLFFDGFVPNGDAWGTGSGVATGTAGDWTITGPALERIFDHRGSSSPTNSLAVDLDASPGNVSITQTVNGLEAGEKYRLSFEIGEANDNPNGASGASLEVYWNGSLVDTYQGASGVMQTIRIDVTATGPTGTLEFREVGTVDYTGTYLANVRLTDQIIIDETPGIDTDSDDTTDPLVIAQFSGVTNPGSDAAMASPQYAAGSTAVVSATSNYGADGAGTQVYGVQTTNGTSSGLSTTDGKAITLYQEGSLVVGRYDSDGVGGVDNAAFAIAVNSATGVASIAQYVSIQHPLNPQGDDGLSLAPGSVLATATITDRDGDTATATANISGFFRFEDDGPRANNDTASVTEDTVLSVTDNVLTNDASGADDPKTFVSWDSPLAGAWGTLVPGANGAFTYNLNNGAVQFLDTGETRTDSFNYTMRDADGDTRTATLTVTINGTNDIPTITTDSGNPQGANDVVYEAGLSPNGSGNGPTTTLVGGTFTVSDADGLDDIVSVTINGNIILIGNLGTAHPSNVIPGPNGTLTVTGYNPATGVATYTYQLTSPATDVSGDETNVFTLTTSDGAVSSAPATITIVIEDDLPTANPDSGNVTEDGTLVASGNVLTNDLSGADTPKAFHSWDTPATSPYGTVALNADGSYTFTLNNSAVQFLDTTETIVQNYNYTMKDADGDPKSSTLTITIHGTNDIPTITTNSGEPLGANDMVYEAGLSPNGSGNGPTTTLVGGTFTVSDADGLDDIVSVTINSTVISIAALQNSGVVNITIPGASGTLTVTGYSAGVATYTYQLTSQTTDVNQGATPETDVFTLTTSDGTASSAPATITIEIIDDLPVAVVDGPAGVTEDGLSNISGDVLTNDVSGADTPKSFVGWGADAGAIAALNTYGTLTQNANGTWSYVLDNTRAATQALTAASNLSHTLNYTMRDADGDTSSSTLTITITGANDSSDVATAAATGPDSTVYESGLNPNGSNAAANTETTTGSFTVSSTDGIANVVIGGTIFTLAQVQAFNGTQTVNTGQGVLTLTGYTGNSFGGTVNYSYTLSATIDNDSIVPTGNDAVTPVHFDDSVTLTVNGIGGTTDSDQLVIRAIDDTPTAFDDGNGLTEDQSAVTGNVLGDGTTPQLSGEDTFGADRPAAVTAVRTGTEVAGTGTAGTLGVALPGTYGTLTLNADGSYTYTRTANLQHLDDGEGVEDVFTYTMRDADGDTDTAQLTIRVTGSNDAPATNPDTNWALEAGYLQPGTQAIGNVLLNQNHPGAPNLAAFADVADTDVDVESLTVAAGTFTSAYGTLVLQSDGSYVYTVNNANPTVDALNPGQTLTDTFTYQATDGTATVPGQLTITIFGTTDYIPPRGGSTTNLSVDEAALDLTATGADLAAGTSTGTTPGSADETDVTFGGFLSSDDPFSFTAGSAVLNVAFAATQAPTIGNLQPNYSIVWTVLGSGQLSGTLMFDADGPGGAAPVSQGEVIRLALDNPSVAPLTSEFVNVTVTLVGDLPHVTSSAANETITINGISVVANDGTTTLPAFVNVTVINDEPIVAANQAITVNVDEDGLPTNNDDAARTGETTGTNNAVATGAAGALSSLVNAGADAPVSFSLNTVSVPVNSGLDSKGGDVMIVSNGTTLRGYVETTGGAGYHAGDREVFTLTVGANGSYTFTLLDQIDHPTLNTLPGDNTENLLANTLDLSSYIKATDLDGDSVNLAAGAFAVQVRDDIPVVTSVANTTVNNTVGASNTGAINFSVGADEPATFSLAGNTAPANLSSNGLPISYYVDPANLGTLIAYTGGNPFTVSNQVFTVSVNASGVYTYTVLQPIDATQVVSIGSSISFGVGPGAYQVLSQTAASPALAIISGGTSGGEINGSVAGWGIGNNNFDTGESIRLDFADQEAGSPGPGTFSGPNVSIATVQFTGYTNGNQITYTVHYMNGSTSNGTVNFTSNADVTLQVPSASNTLPIDWVDFNVVSGGGKFDLLDLSIVTNTGTQTLNFNVGVTDFDGDTATGAFAVTVQPGVNAGDGTINVDESAMASGTTPAATNEVGVTTLALSLGAGGSVSTMSLATGGVTSGGVGVVTSYADSGGTQTLTGYKGSISPANVVFTLTVTDGGLATYTQVGPIDHPTPGASHNENKALTFNYTVTAGANNDSGVITVNVLDDGPIAVNSSRSGAADTTADTNLMLILDVSGSMGFDSNLGMNTMKNAVLELLEQYDALGNVAVRIVTFSSNASEVGTAWMSVAAAKAAVLALTADGSTNYDAALLTAMGAFTDSGKITGAQNLSYFISDGNPTSSSDWPQIGGTQTTDGIQANEQAVWEQFLKDNDVRSNALGMGSSVTVGNLEPVAYDGKAETELAAIVVTDLSQLTQTLVNTITTAPVNGNVITDSVGATFGADGGHLQSITVNGITYTVNTALTSVTPTGSATTGSNTASFNDTTNVLTVTIGTTGDKIAIDMDTGAYTYTPQPNLVSSTSRSIGFALVDNDGDTSAATLNITINVGAAPVILVVRDDLVLTNLNSVGGTETTVIPEWALLANDTGGSGMSAITAVGSASSGTVAQASPIVTFAENGSDSDGGLFSYTNTTGAASDTAVVNIDRAQAGEATLDGTFRNEILIGRDASADTINGGGGNDILIGLGGNDSLNGDAGNDILDGGTGTNIINGGSNDNNNLLVAGNRGDVMVVNGTVNFTALGNDFDNIETISLLAADGSFGNSTITLNYADVLDMADTGVADPTAANFDSLAALRIDGSAGDVVNLVDNGGSTNWVASGLASGTNGVPAGYNLYVHVSSGTTPSSNEQLYVLIQNGVTVNLL